MALEIRGMCPLLQVFDMAASLKFYCDVLGFRIHSADENTAAPNHNWVWLVHGEDVQLMLNTAYEPGQRPSIPDPQRIAAHDDTCLYLGAPDVDAVYAYLQEKGIESDQLHDPDGYGICFQWRAEQGELRESPSG